MTEKNIVEIRDIPQIDEKTELRFATMSISVVISKRTT